MKKKVLLGVLGLLGAGVVAFVAMWLHLSIALGRVLPLFASDYGEDL